MLNKVMNQHQNFDPRTLHTRDKSSWNNMMDSIHNTKNVILIATTQKSPKELYQQIGVENHCMIREGRIDKFILMNHEKISSNLIENNASEILI